MTLSLAVDPSGTNKDQITYTWKLPQEDGGAPVIDYKVRVCIYNDGWICSDHIEGISALTYT